MKRLVWLAVGAGVGALVVRRLSRAATGWASRDVRRDVADAVRNALHGRGDMAEREAELRAALGLAATDLGPNGKRRRTEDAR